MRLFGILLTTLVPIIGVNSQRDCPKNTYFEFGQTNCTNQATATLSYFYEVSDNCLPTCTQYGEDIFGWSCDEVYPCPPPYSCEKRCAGDADDMQKTCESNDDCVTPDNTRIKCSQMCVLSDIGCMAYHAKTLDFQDTYWTAQKFKPECDNEGLWVAKQCKGGQRGRCMCYDSIGNRIFGEAAKEDSADMTCACSRRKADLKAKGITDDTIHCDSMGNYEKLQCVDGICWCADPKTGEPTAPVVPEKAMVKLPCYMKVNVGVQYLRQCESKQHAISKIKSKLIRHGVKYAMMEIVRCDWDGAYGPYAIIDGNVYCTWRNSSKIGTWQGNVAADLPTLDCNCARDTIKYAHNMACSSVGNYESVQTMIDENNNFFNYCVDSDGFAKSDLVPSSVNLICDQYY